MSLSEEALEAFEALKQACMNSPVLAFTDYTKDFLLETDLLHVDFTSIETMMELHQLPRVANVLVF